jgi:hypothetical protein
MIYPPLEELLNYALTANLSPREIRLGTIEMREFKAWAMCTGYLSSRASVGAGAPYEYNDIPVVEVSKESWRSYINEHGNEVIHD